MEKLLVSFSKHQHNFGSKKNSTAILVNVGLSRNLVYL
jgi:hypothetical protein